jgi:PAS domain S-box-containing protein
VPIVMLWHEDGYMIYNDAYSEFAGGRHPHLFGSKVREGWPEVADFNDHVMAVGLAGRTLAYRDQELTLNRHGRPEQVFMDLDYSPVLDEEGRPAGVIAIVVETTEKVMAQRRIRGESERLRRMFERAPGFMATTAGPDHIFETANAAYLSLVGRDDLVGRSLNEVLPEVALQGYIDILNDVFRTGRRFVGENARVLFQPPGQDIAEARFVDFVLEPLRDELGATTGIFIQGNDVTHRKHAEDELRESEQRFRLIADSAPVMLWMSDQHGKCVYLNAAQRRFWGVVDNGVASFDWEATLHPDDLETMYPDYAAAMAEHRSFTTEARYRNAAGVWRLLQTNARPRFDTGGDFLGMIGVNVDVTDLRNEERRRLALIELNDRFRKHDDPADIAYAAGEILGKTLKVGRAGYGTIDPIAETIEIERAWTADGVPTVSGLVHFRDYGDFIEDLKRGEAVIFSDAAQDPRTRNHVDALEAIGVRSMVNLPINEQGGVVALLYVNDKTVRDWTTDEISLIRDIAERTRTAVERRRAEMALGEFAESLERQVAQRTAELDRVWRNSQDILLIADEGGVVRAVNPAWTSILGHSGRLVNGHLLPGFVASEHRATFIATAADVKTGPYTKVVEAKMRHIDGSSRWIAWRLSFEDNLIFAYGRDVTSEKEQAQALKQAEEQLRQAQKMEAIGQLTGGIAHDFNNLLQVISGNLQMLGQDLQADEKSSRRIQNALAGVHRGAKLANQLLAFGRRQPLEPKVVNISRFLQSIGEMLRRTLGETVEVETVTSGGLWNTFVDPAQIENAVLNLAINARDAMEGQGKLTIEVGNAYIDEVYCRSHPEVEPGQYVMLAVTDTGAGMPPQVLERVFEPFFSTKPVGKGTGLGLSMVYGFVKQSGGHVKIYSEVGHGTTIRLYLPRSMQAEDVLTDLEHGPPRGGAETILVAEDDDAVRATVVDILGHLGYRVLKARDAASALSVIESGAPIDLLFTDVVMPGPLKSTELARKARERLPDIAVLFTSGYTENSIVHGGRLDPGVELLSKPYSREALARRIRHLLGNRAQKIESRRRLENIEPRPHDGVALLPDAPAQAPVIERAPLSTSSSLRILAVEDEPFIRLDLVDMLTDEGHQVVEAGSAEEALKEIAAGRFDVLLTDLGLPGMSGEDLARRVREIDPAIGVVFATGNNVAPPLDAGRPPVLLRKPFEPMQLARAVGEAAAGFRTTTFEEQKDETQDA